MIDLRKAAEMELEALEDCLEALRRSEAFGEIKVLYEVITALRQALAQNPLDIADRAYFAGKKDGIAETLAQGEPFKPDWDMIEPYHERIKELEIENEKLRQALAQPEQEPVAWMYDFLNSDNRDEVIRNWVTQDIADIEREKGFNVRPVYTAPPSKQAPFGYVYEINGAHTDFSKELPPDDAYDEGTLVPVFAASPSKPWVSLSDEEIQNSEYFCGDVFLFAYEIEAKLKELNHG